MPIWVLTLILSQVPSFLTTFDHLPTYGYTNHNETLISDSDYD